MRSISSSPLLAAGLLCGGCTTQDLSSSWMIDRLRILAVRPEPAEPAPGDVVSFEALIVDPQGDPEMTIWFGCLSDEAEVMGCLGQMGLDKRSGVDHHRESDVGRQDRSCQWWLSGCNANVHQSAGHGSIERVTEA